MSTVLERYEELKQDIESAKSKAAQAEGALSELKRRLKKEFDCSSLKEAKQVLKELEKESKQLERKLQIALDSFEEQWTSRL